VDFSQPAKVPESSLLCVETLPAVGISTPVESRVDVGEVPAKHQFLADLSARLATLRALEDAAMLGASSTT
jgi:hypothetical protein